jgi:hypothetical protein
MIGKTSDRDLIAKAWDLRFLQRNREARLILDRLQNRPLEVGTEASSETLLEIQLLTASLLRAEASLEKSNAILVSIAESVPLEKQPFQYFLQKALNLFVVGNFSVALEFFLLADKLSLTDHNRAVCLMNVLICLESLGLPTSGTLLELEFVMKRAREQKAAFVLATDAQLQAFYLRRDFRQGQIKILKFQESEDGAQAEFQQAWVHHLAFINSKDFDKEASLRKLFFAEALHAKKYRLKTLMADSAMSDGKETPCNHEVDRLYLWTWNWLASPTERNRKNLSLVLSEFDFPGVLGKVTATSAYMLRNALGWIALFQPKLSSWVKGYVSHLPAAPAEGYGLFDYEAAWISELALSAKSARPFAHRKHSLDKSKDLLFAKFAKTWAGELVKDKSTKASVRVNLSTWTIESKHKKSISKPVCLVIEQLKHHKALSFADALGLAFEIAPYDSEVHSLKIFNIISRVKKVLPTSVKIRTKNEMMYWIGPTSSVQIEDLGPHARAIFNDGVSFGAVKRVAEENFNQIHPRQILPRLRSGNRFSRSELQKALKISKASTARWIRRWSTEGLVTRKGAGKSARYSLEIAQHFRVMDSV